MKKKGNESSLKAAKFKKIAKIFLLVFAISLLTLVGVFLAYKDDYENKTLPNTYFLNQKFDSKSKDEVRSSLDAIEKDLRQQKIKLVKDEKNWEISFADLDYELKRDEIANDVFQYGHSDKTYKNVVPLIRSLASSRRVQIQFTFNEKLADDWLISITSQIATPKQEANVQIKSGKAKVIDPKVGKNIDEIKVKNQIFNCLSSKSTAEIKMELVDDVPLISRDEAEKLLDKAKELSSRKVELVGPKGSVEWGASTLGNLIELKKKLISSGGFLGKKTYGETYVSYDRQKVFDLLEKQSSELNIEPVDAKFQLDGGKVNLLQASSSGKIVDLEAASDKTVGSLEEGKDEKIELPSKVEEASISAQSASDIEKFGIRELIGTATTDFSKSPDNRVHNIQTGVKALSGALIKVGDEFSTIKHLGQIDATSGYLQELVIKGNETKPEFGGGLCQVSTTLFRAAMNSGLKISERQNHSYRVSYYEPPVGMDATIYYPKPDLKFVNDTSAYILIQGRVDGYKITFDFYGTKDGRTVAITDPEIFDIMPPPPDIYIEDPTLAPGEVKRIDRAHNGAKASFSYRVTKNGKTTEQKFTSEYVPWAAKFLRGPAVDGSQPQ